MVVLHQSLRAICNEVLRVQAIRAATGSSEIGADDAEADAGAGLLPQFRDDSLPVVQTRPTWSEHLEFNRLEQAMYRNMYLSTRQVLAVIDKAWDAQVRHRRLPSDLRRELESTRDLLAGFLDKDRGA